MGKYGPTDVLSFPLLPAGAFPPHRGSAPVVASAARRPAIRRPPHSSRPVVGSTSATSSCRWNGRSPRRTRAAAATPATSAGRRPTSCACSSSTARSTSAAGTMPSPPRKRRCERSSAGCSDRQASYRADLGTGGVRGCRRSAFGHRTQHRRWRRRALPPGPDGGGGSRRGRRGRAGGRSGRRRPDPRPAGRRRAGREGGPVGRSRRGSGAAPPSRRRDPIAAASIG